MKSIADIQEKIELGLKNSGMSARQASLLACEREDLIRDIRRGRMPSYERVAKILEVLGMSVQVIDITDEKNLNPSQIESLYRSINLYVGRFNTDSASGLARFTAVDLPVLGWAKCSLSGHILTGEENYPDLPMPEAIEALDDDEVFYAIAKGLSMRPEGIEDGDYCLISPATPVAVGLRVWFKDRQKRATIKRVVGENAAEYELRGWLEPDLGERQRHYQDRWMKLNIAAQGVVLAVYRGKPDLNKPPELIPDPKPPPMPAPPEIAKTLGLEANATVADVIRAIEAKAELGVDAVQEKLRETVEAFQSAAQAVDELKAEAEAATRQVVSQVERAAKSDQVPRQPVDDFTDEAALAHPEVTARPVELPHSRHVEVRKLAAAAGGGAAVLSERVVGYLAFQRDWLERHALEPTQCTVIDVRGDSMEPTLPDGCSILVDRGRRRRLSGHLFVLLAAEGVVVKRLARDGGDDWILVSDNESPEWPDLPWPDETEIIGEVKWMARTFG